MISEKVKVEYKKTHNNDCFWCGITKKEAKKLQKQGDKSGCPGCVYCKSGYDNRHCNDGRHVFYY